MKNTRFAIIALLPLLAQVSLAHAAAVIFNNNDVQTLKQNINLGGGAGVVRILSGTGDPTSVAPESANQGSIYLQQGGSCYLKTDNGSTTNWDKFLGAAAYAQVGNKDMADNSVDFYNPSSTAFLGFDLSTGTAAKRMTIKASPTLNRTLTLPNATDTLVGQATTDTLTNKTISGSSNTFSNIPNSATTATNLNTASAIVARDASGNFTAGAVTANLTGTVTGHSSLDLALTGGTMSGAITGIAGATTGASYNFGTANTGFYGPSTTTIGALSGGSEIGRWGASGLSLLTTTNDAALHVKNVSGGDNTGLALESNTGKVWGFAAETNDFFIVQGSNVYADLKAGWMGLGVTTQAPKYTWDFNVSDTTTDPTTIVPSSVTHNYPTLTIRNTNATANTVECAVLAGSSANPMGEICATNETQTSGSEASHVSLYTQSAGVIKEGLRIKTDQTLQLPHYTSAGVLQVDSSGNVSTASALTNPMTTLGDTIYGGASGAATRLAGDTSNTRKFFREQSSGGVAAAPAWDTLQAADMPAFTGDITTSAGSTATTAAATQSNITTLSNSSGVAVHGTNTNNNASAGYVGEYFESLVARSSALNCNSASTVDVTSLSLTAGDWDISILAQIQNQASWVGISYGISTIATTLPGTAGNNRIDVLAAANSSGDQGWFMTQRLSLSGTTTVYFDCKATSSVLTYGKILARRVR